MTTKSPTAKAAFDLETFTFNGHRLRVVLIDGKLWFSVKDMADALLLDRRFASNSRRFLDDHEVLVATRGEVKTRPQFEVLFPSKSQAAHLMLVAESGLYKIILRAQRSNPAARDFQDWITKTVIPAIRKTGSQIVPIWGFLFHFQILDSNPPRNSCSPGNPPRTRKEPTMTTFLTHLDAAREIIDGNAFATVKAARSAHQGLCHIDAASHLMTAAVELFAAAEDIATGKPVRGHGEELGPDASGLAVSLRVAEAKIAEAKRMLDEGESRSAA